MAKTSEITPDIALRAPFRRMSLTLDARLAEGRAEVGALRDLREGSLVELDTEVGEPARLLANGVEIGKGEIVEVEGRLALRVTRLGRSDA